MPDIPGSPALSAEELAGLRDLHRRDPHYPLNFCRACLHVTPCPTRRLLNAYEEAVEAFGATPALLESVSRTALASVQEAWDARDAQRARAEAAELRAGELDKEADVFCQAYRWMLADRDRERRRAEGLAARVVSLEEACRRAIGAYDNDKNLDNDRYQLRLEREMENLIVALRGAGEVSDGRS